MGIVFSLTLISNLVKSGTLEKNNQLNLCIKDLKTLLVLKHKHVMCQISTIVLIREIKIVALTD